MLMAYIVACRCLCILSIYLSTISGPKLNEFLSIGKQDGPIVWRDILYSIITEVHRALAGQSKALAWRRSTFCYDDETIRRRILHTVIATMLKSAKSLLEARNVLVGSSNIGSSSSIGNSSSSSGNSKL